jgi:hypothetical protein
MSFQDLVENAQQYYPDLQIKYKDQSTFMKILGKILFFNKDFMDSYTTTIGSTVYFPNEKFVKTRPVSASVILLHELIHINDAKKVSKPAFGFLYLFPQILSILFLILMLLSWKLFLPLLVLSLLPIPAYFRMYYEKRAYLVSLYVIQSLSIRLNFKIDLNESKSGFLSQFKGSAYYFMYPFSSIDKDFDSGTQKIINNLRPYDDKVFDTIDVLVKKV